MYGKGDVESVGLVVDPAAGEVLEADFETAANYKPTDFSVKHQAVVEKGPLATPLRFRVISWNHLFSLEKSSGAARSPATGQAAEGSTAGPVLSYFTPELWASYAMWKNPQTLLRKNRAHFVWERGAVP
jgi:hypothetical protein